MKGSTFSIRERKLVVYVPNIKSVKNNKYKQQKSFIPIYRIYLDNEDEEYAIPASRLLDLKNKTMSAFIYSDFSFKINLSKKVPVSDDWHPNYPDNTIKLSTMYSFPSIKNNQSHTASLYNSDDVYTKIVAMGKDDYGFEKSCSRNSDHVSEFEVINQFSKWTKNILDSLPENITADYFTKLGFTYF